jgi:hypothetical protein
MAFYVRYSISCSSDFCTLHVSPMFLLLLKMSVEVTIIQKFPKNPKFAKKEKKCQKRKKAKKRLKFFFAQKPKFSKKAKNGLLCSLRGLCDLHGLRGLFGLLGLSHIVKKQGKQVCSLNRPAGLKIL